MSEAVVRKVIKTIPATRDRYTATPIKAETKRRVAAYARVSTDDEEQQTSYEHRVTHYTQYIQEHEGWLFTGMFTDEGITGTSTKHRDGFNAMINAAMAGKIDLILTKSVSRFARNTVDTLTTVRKLKAAGVEVYFEKEYIETALYLILTPNTGLFFAYCSIYCSFGWLLELAYYGLSLICRLNLL